MVKLGGGIEYIECPKGLDFEEWCKEADARLGPAQAIRATPYISQIEVTNHKTGNAVLSVLNLRLKTLTT